MGLAVLLFVLAGCASDAPIRAPAANLPPVKIGKFSAEPSQPEASDKIAVSTVQPRVGQKVSIQAVIQNKHPSEILVRETFLGTTREHVLQTGESLDVSYDYLRKMSDFELAEYQITAKSEPELVSSYTLKEGREGFGCVGKNFRGSGCRVLSSDKKGQRIPSFRLSIGYGQ